VPFRQFGAVVKTLECLADVFGVILKINDDGGFLAGRGAVET